MKPLPYDYEDTLRIAAEVTLGQPPEVPDTPAMAELRARLVVEIAEIAARGGVVDLPSEIA